MKKTSVIALTAACFSLGIGIGFAAKPKGPGMDIISNKTPQEAGLAALKQAEALAGEGTWERIAVARAYYLSGDKPKGQSLIDAVLKGKNDKGDWQRIGQLYADAGEAAKAEEFFNRVLAADAKDDSAQVEIGAWYVRQGQRAKGEALFAQAFAKHSDDMQHYLHVGEAFLNVPRDGAK